MRNYRKRSRSRSPSSKSKSSRSARKRSRSRSPSPIQYSMKSTMNQLNQLKNEIVLLNKENSKLYNYLMKSMNN